VHPVERDIRKWSHEFLEVPNKKLNGLPPCPYAKQAWLDNKVVFSINTGVDGLAKEVADFECHDYDIVVGSKRIDVKTKQTTVAPLPHYECSVAAFNTRQKCDAYAFVRVLKDLSVGWFLGVSEKDQYFNTATFMKKGDIDPSNNFTVRADCYNLRIDKLGDAI